MAEPKDKKKLLKAFVILFLISFLIINWKDISWVFNYKAVSGVFSNFFQKAVVGLLKLRDIENISVIGLPLALSISVIFQLFLLIFFLKRKIKILNYKKIFLSLKKILIASFLMSILIYFTLQVFPLIGGNTKTVLGILLQALLALIVGISAYIFFSLSLKLKEPKLIFSSIFHQFKRKH